MLADVISKFNSAIRNLAASTGTKSIFILQKRRHARLLSTKTEPKIADCNVPVESIRNFCIIAHVDHGKSTLADRFIEITGGFTFSKDVQQVLDRLPVEKERGITVKSVCASLNYTYNDVSYTLNLIDTPGHVDFSNEVSRSIFACQGAILLVDANQGVQAQTIANFYQAFTKELTIIPVLNKIDLPQANPDAVAKELENLFGFSNSEIFRISAKTGLGVEDLLKAVIERIPAPNVSREEPFKALLIDSWFDKYRGALLFIYVAGGQVKPGDVVVSFKDKKKYTVKSTSKLVPEEIEVNQLPAGQVGVIGCNLKKIDEAHIGDTLHAADVEVEPLQSFSASKPTVFAGVYPRDQSDRLALKSALEKLCLNDPSVTVALENSPALGQGWRLGFLGLLHLDVFRQRLEQEYEAEAILTAPGVTYKVKVIGQKAIKEYGGEIVDIKNPVNFPTVKTIVEETFEPVVLGTIVTPLRYYEAIREECLSRRAVEESTTPLESNRMLFKFTIPLSEIIFDFHDKLKRMSSGYASFDYEDKGFQSAPLQKLSILFNGKEVEELTTIVHEERVRDTAVRLCSKLQELIPRQQVEIRIQAAVGSTIIAKRTIKPYRKDVTAKLYGGDVTRKMKLLKNQKEGKKKMRMLFNLQIDRDTFIDVLREK